MNNNNNSTNSNANPPKKFNINYQIAFENYSKIIKYYVKNRQLIDDLEKILFGYKDIIKDFQKKLIQLNANLTKLSTNNEKYFYTNDTNIYPLIKKYIKFIKNILIYQIDSFSELINDLENHIIFKSNIKKDDNYINILQQNRINLQNEEKKMEKLIIEYDNEYDILMDTFRCSEDIIKQFFARKRKNSIENKKQRKNSILEQTISETLNSEEQFNIIHLNFRKCNKNYFENYEAYLKELEIEINNNFTYLDKIVNEFISILFYNYNNINKKIIQLNMNLINKKEEQSEPNNKIGDNESLKNKEEEKNIVANNDFSLFKNKYLNRFEKKYGKEKYKIRSIHETIDKDNLSQETKNIMNILTDEFGMDDFFHETPIIITEEDVYEIAKTFYGAFQFIDKSEYDLITEKKKLEIKNLTNKLLYFGLKKRSKEFKDLKEINEKEVETLEKNFSRKEYRITFLRRLNNFRTIGVFEIPKNEFEIICRYFKNIADYITEEKDNDSMKYVLILPQTFYTNKDGEKYYIQKELKGHKLFNDKEYIEQYIKLRINEEIQKLKANIKKNNLEEKNYSLGTVAFSNLLPFCDNMIGFGMKKEILMEIIEPLFEEYKISEEMKQNIQGIIKSKSTDM